MPPIQSVREYMDALRGSFDPSRAAGQSATVQYVFTGTVTGACYLRVTDGALTVGEGQASGPTVTVTSDFATWMRIVNYDHDPLMAWQEGLYTVEGDMEKLIECDAWFPRK